MVSVALDAQGGVNLLFCQTTDPVGTLNVDTNVVVRYARWPAFDWIEAGLPAYTLQTLSAAHRPIPGTGARDYNMITAAGCFVHAAWAQTSGQLAGEIYTTRIRLDTNLAPCTPDPTCYVNCDGSTEDPTLNVADFSCFLQLFAEGQFLPHAQQLTWYANCDGSTEPPVLNVADFNCFLQKFAAGCF